MLRIADHDDTGTAWFGKSGTSTSGSSCRIIGRVAGRHEPVDAASNDATSSALAFGMLSCALSAGAVFVGLGTGRRRALARHAAVPAIAAGAVVASGLAKLVLGFVTIVRADRFDRGFVLLVAAHFDQLGVEYFTQLEHDVRTDPTLVCSTCRDFARGRDKPVDLVGGGRRQSQG